MDRGSIIGNNIWQICFPFRIKIDYHQCLRAKLFSPAKNEIYILINLPELTNLSHSYLGTTQYYKKLLPTQEILIMEMLYPWGKIAFALQKISFAAFSNLCSTTKLLMVFSLLKWLKMGSPKFSGGNNNKIWKSFIVEYNKEFKNIWKIRFEINAVI